MAAATGSKPTHYSRGVALCLVSALGFGCMAIFAKDAYRQHLGINALLALRFALAAALFWTIARLRGPIRIPPRRTLLAALGLGAVGYAAQSGLFFGAVKRMDASTTSLLLYTYPAMVFIAALALRREHADRRRVLALAFACAGTALVLLGGGGSGSFEKVGVIMAIGAAVAYSSYILVADSIVGRLDPFVLSALITTGAAATFWTRGPGRRRPGLQPEPARLAGHRGDRGGLHRAAHLHVPGRPAARRPFDREHPVVLRAGRDRVAGDGALRRAAGRRTASRRRAGAFRGRAAAG